MVKSAKGADLIFLLPNSWNCEPPRESGRCFLMPWVPLSNWKAKWCKKMTLGSFLACFHLLKNVCFQYKAIYSLFSLFSAGSYSQINYESKLPLIITKPPKTPNYSYLCSDAIPIPICSVFFLILVRIQTFIQKLVWKCSGFTSKSLDWTENWRMNTDNWSF